MWYLITDPTHEDYCIEQCPGNIVLHHNGCWFTDLFEFLSSDYKECPNYSEDSKNIPTTEEEYIKEAISDRYELVFKSEHHPSTWKQHYPELFI